MPTNPANPTPAHAPTAATLLALAERVAALPHADPRTLARTHWLLQTVRAAGWSPATASAQVLRHLPWLAIYRHLGRTRGLTGTAIQAMSPAELLQALTQHDPASGDIRLAAA